MMEKEKAGNRINELRRLIKEYDYNYYVLDAPLIDDYQYDLLYRELKDLESEHPELDSDDSPTKRVSERNVRSFLKADHNPKMYSLENTYSDEELEAFHMRIAESIEGDFSYSVEPKIDGTAISVIYEDSKLKTALTRGDGEKGDDVTENIRTIRELPLALSKRIEGSLTVRGEVFFTKRRFEELNETYGFSNPRNAAAGTLKLLSPSEVSKRRLSILIHTVVTPIKETHTETLMELSEMGLPVVRAIAEARGIGELIKAKNDFDRERYSLPYETDGIVIKLNQLKLRERVGLTSKSPKWAFAFKFTPKRAVTKLESVSFQVGRTGVITPVANLSPVDLSGTTVKRATLHNFQEIERLSLKEGDYVEIEKSGEIIPKVLRVLTERRTGGEAGIVQPAKCPSCGEKLVKYEDEVAVRCINRNCPEQIELSLIHFASKRAMNIENMGPSVIERLIEKGFVRSISDIYSLTLNDLLSLDRIKGKSASRLLQSIAESRKRPLSKLIFGLGIRNVGEFAALNLSERFRTIHSLMSAQTEELTSVFGIGEETAKAIRIFFENRTNREEIERLLNAGVTMEHSGRGGSLSGKFFVVTGTLKRFSRDEATDYITSLGGTVQNDVSKKTQYLVAGENPGSKIDKAKKLSVKVISEDELILMAEDK